MRKNKRKLKLVELKSLYQNVCETLLHCTVVNDDIENDYILNDSSFDGKMKIESHRSKLTCD